MPENNEAEVVYNALIELGLKPYEARVYLALVDGKERSATEIVSVTGVPQPRVYSVLESLAAKGLVEILLTKPKKYRAVEPSVAIDRLVETTTERLRSRAKAVMQLISGLYSSAPESLGVKVIKNKSEALDRARRAIENSSYDVLIAAPPILLEELTPSILSLHRATPHRIIAIVAYGQESHLPEELEEVVVRVRPLGVLPVVFVDSKRCLIMRESHALEVTEEDLVRMLLDFYYHTLWKTSTASKAPLLRKEEEYLTTNVWLAVELWNVARKLGYTLSATIEGRLRKTDMPVTVTGIIREIYENSQGVQITVVIEGEKGVFSVGGLGAQIEDVEGKVFRLKPI